MATSTTELILKFTGDPSQLKQTLAAVRSDLSSTAQEQRNATKSVETAARGELTVRQQLAAAASLQRQRSAALIAQWKKEERAALDAASGTRSVKDVLQQLSATVATFQGPLGAISGRISSLGTVVSGASTGLSELSGAAATAGSSVAGMAGPIGIAAVAAVALSAGAAIAAKELITLTKQASDFQGRMFDLAQQTGLAVKTLSALEVVSVTTGGELGSITQAIVLFQRQLDDAQDPLSKTAEKFRTLGVDTSDTETSLRSAFAALAKMPEGFAQTNAAAELFGARGGKQVLAILKETQGDLDGTIKRLRELGVLISEDDARAADILNDQLAILEFQTRALEAVFARELIPVLADLARTTGELVTSLRPLISLLGSATGAAARFTSEQFKALSIIVQALTKDYVGLAKSIKDAHDAQQINPITVPTVGPVPLPNAPTALQTSSETVAAADAVLAEVKRKAAQTNQALDEAFQKGRISRSQLTAEVIQDNKRILDAETARIDAELAKKEQEIKALDEAATKRGEIVNRETEQYRAINAAVAKLQQERLDKESEFDVTSRELRARAAQERAQSLRSQIQNEGDIFVKETDITIAKIEAEIKRGARAESEGLTLIDQLEQQRAESRIQTLQRQKEVGFLTIQEQKDLDSQILTLQQERDRLDDEQKARRLQRESEAAARTRDIVIANLDAILQQEQIIGERRISTIKALADQRVITEEDAAKQILAIRLGLIDDEIAAVNAKLTASKSITDKNERVKVQADLNNQIKILTEQRITIQAEGERDIEAGRQKDLENERRYADDLKEIKERVNRIERDAAQTVIRLMEIGHASARSIIKARLQLYLDDENARHRQALETIDNLKRENAESQKTKEQKLEEEKELNLLSEAEEKRHQLELEAIKAEAERAKALEGPAGGFLGGLQSGQLKELQSGITSFADVATVAFSAVGAAVSGLAQGVGSLLQNWVLLGSQADINMKKMVASVLAGVAAQAGIQAVYELALGIAALTPWGAVIYGPAVAHFKAAALLGSIAFGAAALGRLTAGSSFQTQGSQGTTGGSRSAPSGGGGGATTTTPPAFESDRRTLNQQNITLLVNVKRDAGSIVDVVVDDHRSNGPIRQMILSEK